MKFFRILLLLPSAAFAEVDFETQIEPIFAEHCFECHGDEKQKGQLRLNRLSSLLKGGDIGEPAVVPGDPGGSFLMTALRHEEAGYEMPSEGEQLTAAQIALIEKWIVEGAKTPERYGAATESVELSHWSFLPVKRPAAAGDIDGFIQLRLKEAGLQPSPEADRRTLIRRLFLVMLGLPPSPERVEAFVNDQREDAWRLLVGEVLASPRYGERWASHWLDLARFGETHGFETNRERPTAWHFRDWVIAAFNDDKPYDQFVREQIAGDVLGEDIGTGFLVAGPWDNVKGQDPKLGQMQRMNELDDMINTTGTAFLGLTTGCARCHNHKFDPISQKDYYAMQAVFAGVQHGDRALPLSEETKQQITALETEIQSLKKQLTKFIVKENGSLRPAVTAKHNEEAFEARNAKFLKFNILKSSGAQACIDELEIFAGKTNVALKAKATSGGDFVHPLHKLEHINDGEYGNAKSWIAADKTGWVQIELAKTAMIERIEWARDRQGKYGDRVATEYRIESSLDGENWEVLGSSDDRAPFQSAKTETQYDFTNHPDGKQLHTRLKAAQAEKSALEKSTLIYAGKFAHPGPTHRLYRGEPDAKRERVGPGGIDALHELEIPLEAPERDRRAALADWIASPDNPLTARVVVNRLWQFHFGVGIVDTPSDFGLNGTAPTHPQLLDWLAAEVIEKGWSLKHIHRQILLSATWRQSNRPNTEAMQIDASSRLLWRFPTRRLEAEGIRDSILSVSGALNLEESGGPGFSPFEVEMENVRHYHPKKEYGPADWRRMIYMTKVRQERDQVFGAFDCPDASQAVPKRSRSTTPLQALNLLNSNFVMQQADLFAQRLSNSDQPIKEAFELCFGRAPTKAELTDAQSFIESEGLIQFTRAMLNANEFVFVP